MRSKDLARIVHDDESLYMSAHDPYEFQTLFEELAWYARKYGSVQLELDEHVFTVESRGAAARCGSCGGALIPPSFQEGLGLPVCVRCASSRICPRLRYSPAPARPRPRVV